MARSIEKAQSISQARKVDVREYVDKLDDAQFVALLAQFYSEAEDSGFYCSVEKAIEMKAYFFLHPQREIAEAILRSVFQKKKTNIFVSISRQIGKTQVIAMVTEFCLTHHFEVFGRPMRILIISPEKGTSLEVFSRVKNYVIARETDLAVDKSNEIETIEGDKIVLYGLYSSHGGTIEGRTFDYIIRDESHLGNEDKWVDQVIPTTNRTAGPIICIGNGGFSDCYFYQGLRRGSDASGRNKVFIYNYHTLLDYMESLGRMGLSSATDWLRATEEYVTLVGGWDSIFARKNVLCEWILELGSYLTMTDIDSCGSVDVSEVGNRFFLGYDVAYKGQDRSVCCVMDNMRNVLDFWVIKEVGEMVSLEDQAMILRERCDSMGITGMIDTIGVDSTGLGVGAAEAIERAFPTTSVVRFEFTTAKKMNWYLHFRDAVISSMPGHKPRFNRLLVPYSARGGVVMSGTTLSTAMRELCDMEIKVYENGLLGFHAPTSGKLIGKSVNDDFVAAAVLAYNSMGASLGFSPLLGLSLPSRQLAVGYSGHVGGGPPAEFASGVPPKLAALRRRAKLGYSS